MAQVFKPYHNTLAKLSVIVLATLPWVVIFGGSAISRSPANTNVGIPIDQPVAFSHQHHAWELGIDCRYCHVSVEKAAYAGIPPTETCMSCHSQIWTNSPLLEPVRESWETGQPIKWEDGSPGWKLVNNAPEFVYFDHSIHVNKGVQCNNCHGAVQHMHLTWKGNAFSMLWCLTCHREPEKYLYKDPKNPHLSPRQQVFNLYAKYQKDPAMKNMTPQERMLLRGVTDKPTQDPTEGVELVKQRQLQTNQLTDCTICHR